MIKIAQWKMLRLIVHTKKKYKPKKVTAIKKDEGTEKMEEKDKEGMIDKETEDGSEQSSNTDQDSDVSFQEDVDEEIDAIENEEDWVEYIKRSTKEVEDHMEKQKNPCWIETHRRLKWRMARRIASLLEKRWTKIICDWHPGPHTSIKTLTQVGRPKRRWEDDLNEFLNTEETQEKTKYDLMNNNGWMTEATKFKEWKRKEEHSMKI